MMFKIVWEDDYEEYSDLIEVKNLTELDKELTYYYDTHYNSSTIFRAYDLDGNLVADEWGLK